MAKPESNKDNWLTSPVVTAGLTIKVLCLRFTLMSSLHERPNVITNKVIPTKYIRQCSAQADLMVELWP